MRGIARCISRQAATDSAVSDVALGRIALLQSGSPKAMGAGHPQCSGMFD